MKQIRAVWPNREPVDLAKAMGNHRVLFCGEEHILHDRVDDEIIRALPDLARLGVTHWGRETLTATPAMKAALEAYYISGKETDLDVIWQLLPTPDKVPRVFGLFDYNLPREEESGLDRSGMDRKSKRQVQFERVIREARKHGVRIVALDKPGDLYWKYWLTLLTFLQFRLMANYSWARRIAKILRNPQAKMIVSSGMLHAGYPQSQWISFIVPKPTNKILSVQGYSGSVVHFLGKTDLLDGETANLLTATFTAKNLFLGRVLRAEKWASQAHMWPTRGEMGCDFIVVLPKSS